MILFYDERTYANVDALWNVSNNRDFGDQAEINQQLFAQVMGWA